ncbi:hypothetical protein MVEN_01409400 [Mycena venus]|uniref:DUF6534 domain-containing protein n=1 Tax=Mycena venus TaxID=2733690 RepID=A0A8H6XZ19_9AGAR|nr:hypothetical protein MVEN_01409400 [Mycena venus]
MSSTSLNIILGAVVLAGIFGALFFGGACIQTYNYYHKHRSDNIVVNGAVATLWAVNALHFAVYTYTIWYYIVEALDTAWIPQIMNWSFKFSVWLSVALVLLLDIFYTFYIFKLSPTLVVPGLVGLTVAAGNIVAVVLGVRIIIFTHFTNIYAISASALIYLFFGLFCVKSTSIAAAMTYYLSRSNDGFTKESNNFIRRPIKLIIGSSLFVAYVVLSSLLFRNACHLAMPHSMSCVVVYMIVSKVYHNCFLSLLACREVESASDMLAVTGIPTQDMRMARVQSQVEQSTLGSVNEDAEAGLKA